MSIVLPSMEKFTVGDKEFSVSFSRHCVNLNASFVSLDIIETDTARRLRKESGIAVVEDPTRNFLCAESKRIYMILDD